MRRWVAGTVLLGCLLGCLCGCTPEGAGGTRGTAGPDPSRTASAPLPAPAASRSPSRATEPVVLAVHATAPPGGLTRPAARRVLRGDAPRWRVVAAPGMPTGPDVPALRSARSVLRAVQREPGTLGVVPAGAVGPTVGRLRVGGLDPLRQPHRYPLHTPGRPPPRPTTLAVVGDLMLTRGVTDPAGALRPLSARLRRADVTVGNLESTLSRAGPPQQGDDSFGAGPAVLRPLVGAGFDALSLANNHTGDFGEAALLATVRTLRRSPVTPFGAGADRAEAGRAAIVERNGVRFAFLAFNAIGETPAAGPTTAGALSVRMPPRTGPLSEPELGHVLRRVRAVAERTDVVVVLPHWGTQYTHDPEPVQRLVGRRLVAAGADLVVGGHPHWVQGLDAHGGAVVAHSLGNFVFDMDFMEQTRQGVVLEATFWRGRLKAVDLVPYGMDAGFAPRPVVGQEAGDILADVWSTSTGPFALTGAAGRARPR